jgi:protein SCO1/2
MVGLLLLGFATDGGRGFTTETLRRSEVSREARTLPDFGLIDQNDRTTDLHALLAQDNKVWIVDFIYTRCTTVCSALGSVYQQLQRRIVERGLQNRIGLLSISFDPRHDDPAALRDYASRMRATASVWRLATLAAPSERETLLDAFGVFVVPGPYGQFEHNAALCIVDRRGRLVAIEDYDAVEQTLAAALAVPP